MSSNRMWVKAYIKGWSFEEEQGTYTIYAIISIPVKSIKKIENDCKGFLEINNGSFIEIKIDPSQSCIKTKLDNCKTDKRYIYIKLKVYNNEIARDSIRASFKEKVRILLGVCGNEEGNGNPNENTICDYCIYGIEKLYKHSS